MRCCSDPRKSFHLVLLLLILLLQCMNQPAPDAAPNGCASFDAVSATLHVPCLSLQGSVYSFDATLATGSYIVTVDGLSFDALFGQAPPPASELPYLWVALSSPPISLGEVNGIVLSPYVWSGDASQTDKVVSNLRATLRQVYVKARGEGKRFIVVGHSWGTILTFLALALESGGNAPIVSDLYITLGSPLKTDNAPPAHDLVSTSVSGLIKDYTDGWVSGVLSSANCPTCVPEISGVWKNYWALTDYISGPLNATFSRSIDTQVDAQVTSGTRPSFSQQTTGYWHEFTSLACSDYCSPGDNLWLQNEIKTLVQTVTNGLMLQKVGLGSVLSSNLQCATVDPGSSLVHVPCLELGGENWWLDLHAVSFEPVVFELKDYGLSK